MPKAIITISQKATEKLVSMLKSKGYINALFSVQGGGCNGMKYVIEPLTEKPHKLDEMISLNKDNNLYVCGKSMIFILGTHIDLIEDFMGESFSFNNPNVQNTCGCGSTFTPNGKIHNN